MSEWKAKRFWKEARVVEAEGGYSVELDGRGVKTPAKRKLVVPTRAMAQAIAEEWDAQEGEIDPGQMPVTRSANAAIDKVALQHAEVARMLADYADSDLLCYRAESPAELVTRQAEAWDPLLDWADREFGARLIPVSGVMHQPQSPKALEVMAKRAHGMDNFTLTAFHDLVGLSGSFVIGLAAMHDMRETRALWQLSRVDEQWQEELWGPDEEATAVAARKESEFLHAKRFLNLAQ
ncbi:ATPase [Roseovarius sp. A21]|uniref:ATPase n=1 Tax=Roseovarius bejariae TaxID=2576383 RepID=A0A844CVD8_9RHOB|nr:ATP12 family protein [Roseovarius bejariae]MRU15136.1 ATPase [Roseovarius bejariae]